ncbi:ankyrin repeat and KH domain-containing protein 1-like [Homarus americanus]|uniref:ankyrin repeat and KH domain-containing protein 1-like n=1 Tax=Homarus americanus TaxID=6706 RepID=UPI001C481C37|nr:ankyrin repeat and KH domain-containing protein 1-like [Homarus americanus]XP_042238642.1 ankyrin repeat and KH domain-containing protein 1-like [Homarus americanus]
MTTVWGDRSLCWGVLLCLLVPLLLLLDGQAAAQSTADGLNLNTPENIAGLKELIATASTLKNISDPQILEQLATLILQNSYINQAIRVTGLVDFQNLQGHSLLTLAASKGMISLAKTLLDAGAFVDLMDESGWTSLIWAVRNNQTEMVKFLLQYNPDVNIKNKNYGDTALIWGAHNGDLTIVLDLLAAGALTNLPDNDGDTPLIQSAGGYGERAEVTRQLLKYGAQVDHHNNLGWTALMWATRKGHLEVVKLMLAAKADPDKKNFEYGDTALGWASAEGNTDVVRELVAAGANLNLKNDNGISPLTLATKKNHPEVARILLAAGADINQQGEDGDTALMEAVFKEMQGMVEVLLQYCPDLDIFNQNRKTVTSIAFQRKNLEIKNMISGHKDKSCIHNNRIHVVGETRYDNCRQVRCCHGLWTPTGVALSTCGRSCKTVGSPAGICTLVDQCPQLADEYNKAQSFDEKAHFIRIYSCRYRSDEDVQVCCPIT